jgi:hypothetical protein
MHLLINELKNVFEKSGSLTDFFLILWLEEASFFVFMTLIPCCVDRVKLKITLRGVWGDNFTWLMARQFIRNIRVEKVLTWETWKSQREIISHTNRWQWKSKILLLIVFWYIPDPWLNFQKIFKSRLCVF